MLVLAGAVGTLLYLPFSPRVRLLFRLVSRALTGFVISVDPIGILKDRLSQMTKRREEMEEQVRSVRGAVGTLKQAINDNGRTSATLKSKAHEAKNLSIAAEDPERKLRMAAQVKINTNEAARLDKANERYADLLIRLEKIYKMLTTLGVSIDTYIQDMHNEVRQQEIQHKTIGAAHKAFSSAMRVLKGNATEEDIYNTTLEFLADEAGRKLGEMEDMQRLAQTFMDKIDVENASLTDADLKMLDSYETKLLTPGAVTAQIPAAKTTVNVQSTGNSKGYNGYFMK
jgi:hypothetical protein